MQRTYQLTLTERQAGVISRALELFARLGMGQFDEAILLEHQMRTKSYRHEFGELFNKLKLDALGLSSPNAYFGIKAVEVPEDCRVGWDIYQVVRHRLAWDRNPKGGIQVDFHEPWRTSLEEGLPIIQHAEEGNEEWNDAAGRASAHEKQKPEIISSVASTGASDP